MSRWLITGGCGFIGCNLVQQLLHHGNVVRVIDNLSVGSRSDLQRIHPFVEHTFGEQQDQKARHNLELCVGDILDEPFLHSVISGVDVLVHLAANTGVATSISDPRSDCSTNIVGILNCLEACRHNGVRRFVYASSSAVLGNCAPPLHEDLPPHPMSPYGASKLAGEAYCSAYSQSFGLDCVVLRFGNCYGPLSHHKASVVAKFINEAIGNEPWQIFGDGKQTRDFVYVDDVVQAIVSAATFPTIGGDVFQIATSCETTVLELVQELAEVLQTYQIKPPEITNAPPRVGDVRRNFSNTSKARSMLNWTAKVTLREGLERTVRWYLEEHQKFNGAV